MMYMGSKRKHAAEIVQVTCANRGRFKTYVEPFVGGGNVICKVAGPRIASDINQKMIALLDAVGNRNWCPPKETITETEWLKIKNNQDKFPDELVAFAATGLTFGSSWFAPFVQKSKGYEKEGAYYKLAREAVLRDAPGLRGIKFFSLRYQDLTPHIPPQSIIYCDPPYAGTTGYGGAKTDIAVGQDLSLNAWDCVAFWRWADQMVEAGHRVYVSEYAGPPPGIYGGTSPRREAAAARFRALQADQQSTREAREVAAAEMRAIQAEERVEAIRLAARWACVWEKEVVSSFDSGRGTESKREVERLFHRGT